MARRRFRFREYLIAPDGAAMPEFGAECVSGEAADCGAESGVMLGLAEVERWIAEHVRDTGHSHYRRTAGEYVTASPGEWS
ncbi:hypothetical protein ABH932_005863 [Streptacidiphilus sp. MAP5-52]